MVTRASLKYGHAMRRPLLVTLGLALLAPLAAAQPGALEAVQARRARGLLVVTATGKAAATAPLVARLRSGTRTALETPVAVENGAVEVELLTTRALLPGSYVLEVGAAGKPPLLEAPLVVGDAAEAKASAERMDAWYRAAAGALRDLAASLDRRGHYHRAQIAADQVHRDRLEAFLEGWKAALRAARMDLANLERRLLLPPRPEVIEALLKVVAELEAHSEAWLNGLHSRATIPPRLAVDAAAAALLVALGRTAEERTAHLQDWRAGPLATPPAGSPPGTAAQAGPYRDPDGGFTLEVPAGWRALEADRKPEERLRLSSPDDQVSLVVEVQPLPDARTPAQLEAAVEVLAWEGYNAYKALARAPIVEGGVTVGLQITFEADVTTGDHTRVRVVQTSRWPAQGGRVVHAIVVRHVGAPPPTDGLEALVERSFRPL